MFITIFCGISAQHALIRGILFNRRCNHRSSYPWRFCVIELSKSHLILLFDFSVKFSYRMEFKSFLQKALKWSVKICKFYLHTRESYFFTICLNTYLIIMTHNNLSYCEYLTQIKCKCDLINIFPYHEWNPSTKNANLSFSVSRINSFILKYVQSW